MFEIGLFSSGYLALIEIGIVYLKRLWIDKIRIIYIVHFCAIFQKFCSGGGSNSYEKAFFAPLICEKILASVYFSPPEYILSPLLNICSGGSKKNHLRSHMPLHQKFLNFILTLFSIGGGLFTPPGGFHDFR